MMALMFNLPYGTERGIMSDTNSVIISTNFWRVPSVERCFDGWLEGAPTPEERLQVIAKTELDRAAWKPSPEGMALVETLKAFIGKTVTIQFWDSCMYLLEEEGPNPLKASVVGVVLLQDVEHLQAYLEVSNLSEVPTPDGYNPMVFLLQRPESQYQLAPLSEVYSVNAL